MSEFNKGINILELTKKIAARGYPVWLQAKGLSMYPFIRDGEIVEIKPVDITEIHIGDIILYQRSEGASVIHRVIKKLLYSKKIVFLTKGDANLLFDKLVEAEQIVGKVVAVKKENRIIKIDSNPRLLVNILYIKFLFFTQWIYASFKVGIEIIRKIFFFS